MYTHKMNINKFKELQTIKKWYYIINQKWELSKYPVSVQVDYRIITKELIKKYGEITLDNVMSLCPHYGHNKIIIDLIKLNLFKTEQKEILHNNFFDNDFKEKMKQCFDKYFNFTGDYMITISLK